MKRTHIDLFDDYNWEWTLSFASITGGVLDIIADNGYGRTSPYGNWYSGASDDFIMEVDFKQDSAVDYGVVMRVKLVDDAQKISFYLNGLSDTMKIYHGEERASQSFVDDTSWHTAKIRRAGTTYYFSIDGGSEISWDYGTERAVDFIELVMQGGTAEYDNFKYYPVEIGKGVGVGNPMIL